MAKRPVAPSDDEDQKQDSEFARMFEDSLKTDKVNKRFSPGDRVEGEIVVAGKDEIYVSLGGNRDGVARRAELSMPKESSRIKSAIASSSSSTM